MPITPGHTRGARPDRRSASEQLQFGGQPPGVYMETALFVKHTTLLRPLGLAPRRVKRFGGHRKPPGTTEDVRAQARKYLRSQ